MISDEYEDRILNEKDYQYGLRDIYNIESILKAKPHTTKKTYTNPIHEKSIIENVEIYDTEAKKRKKLGLPEIKTIETQTDTLMNEIKQMYPSINKEELKQLIKRYPD